MFDVKFKKMILIAVPYCLCTKSHIPVFVLTSQIFTNTLYSVLACLHIVVYTGHGRKLSFLVMKVFKCIFIKINKIFWGIL